MGRVEVGERGGDRSAHRLLRGNAGDVAEKITFFPRGRCTVLFPAAAFTLPQADPGWTHESSRHST